VGNCSRSPGRSAGDTESSDVAHEKGLRDRMISPSCWGVAFGGPRWRILAQAHHAAEETLGHRDMVGKEGGCATVNAQWAKARR